MSREQHNNISRFHSIAQHLLHQYALAWTQQDVAILRTLFADHATYQEGPFRDPLVGLPAISRYWATKVVIAQANITFQLRSLIACDPYAVAEWEARFSDLSANKEKTIREIAVIEIRQNVIVSLREYWHTQVDN
jgi:hypothetical protein